MSRGAPADQRGPWYSEGSMMMTVTVTRASDSQRGLVVTGPCFFFLVGPDGQKGPDCPDAVLCRFLHRFRDLCEDPDCFRRIDAEIEYGIRR